MRKESKKSRKLKRNLQRLGKLIFEKIEIKSFNLKY